MPKCRPVPDDFAALAPRLNVTAAVKHWDTGWKTVERWEKATGVLCHRGNSGILAPLDFAERCVNLSMTALADHYERSPHTIRAWCRQLNVTPKQHSLRRPIPDDWEALCKKHYKEELLNLLGTSTEVIARWIAESGIKPKRIKVDAMFNRFKEGGHKGVQFAAPRSASELARDYLCRTGLRPMVCRCDERANATPHGKLWRIGNSFTPLTDQQLLRRALDRGMVL